MKRMHIRDFARSLRRSTTETEALVWSRLRQRPLGGYRFRRQRPIGRYVADFVCLEQRLAIELDGGQHAEQAKYDRARDDYLRQRGFRVLRLWNSEVMGDLDATLDAILTALKAPDPTAPPEGELSRSD